jgi:hypothetical protein
MKPTEMDADLAQITEPEQLSRRLSYWETRLRLTRPSVEMTNECADIAKRHSMRVAKVLGAG